MSNITFSYIKPAAVKSGHTGSILAMVEKAGFKIVALKKTKLSLENAKVFYQIHKDQPFFERLMEHTTSGPIVAMILEKENAVQSFRELIGSTDPNKSEPGTIRKLYGEDVTANAIHGSDSDENAKIESFFFFSFVERF